MNKLLKVVLFGLALTVGMTACKKTEEAATTAAPEVVAPAAVEVPSETDDLKADYEELTVNENTENLETEERLLEELINDQANKPEEPEESTENQAINEEIKERITSKMDIILSEKIKSKTDNFPSEDEKEEVTRSFKSPKDTIKILYYQDERMLDVLCSKYDLSIEEVLKQKQARDGKRMILGID